MSSKRPLGLPSGNTPGKPRLKTSRMAPIARRTLVFHDDRGETEKTSNNPKWNDKEMCGLVQFIPLYSEHAATNVWPRHKDVEFWERCGRAVSEYSGLPQRSGTACRRKVQKQLFQFKTVDDAERFYKIDYFEGYQTSDTAFTPEQNFEPASTRTSTPDPLSPIFHQHPSNTEAAHLPTGDLIKHLHYGFHKMTQLQRVQLLSLLFSIHLSFDLGVDPSFVPSDFIKLAGCSFRNLSAAGLSNTLYFLARGVGELREDGSGPRLPLDRMPFGLIHHNLEFFAQDDATNLHPCDHYAEWQTTMFAHFGHKWDRLFRGPMWSYDGESSDDEELGCSLSETSTSNNISSSCGVDLISQAVIETEGLAEVMSVTAEECDHATTPVEVSSLWSSLSANDQAELEQSTVHPRDMEEHHNVRPPKVKRKKLKKNPMKAKVNVAGLSARQLRRRIQQKGFTRDTKIQTEALKMAKRRNPSGRWWIKADACDIRSGVMESMRHEWSGDVDLGDGHLEALYQKYTSLLEFVKGIGLQRRNSVKQIVGDLQQESTTLQEDATFLKAGLRTSKDMYERKRKQTNVPESNLFALAWDVTAYETLLSLNGDLHARCGDVINRCLGPSNQKGNVPLLLSKLRKDLATYIKDVFSKRRDAATHLMIFMIADERRDLKPYAIPVRALPFKSIKDDKVRFLRDELKVEMENLGMVVVGFVTDGEFNSLRTKGSERPVSVIQLIMDAKNESNSISSRDIEKYLKPIHVGNIASLSPMRILSIDPRKLVWTIPCFPVLTLEFKRVNIQWNREQVNGLIKFDLVLGDRFPLDIVCMSCCNISIGSDEFLVVWELTHEKTCQDVDDGQLNTIEETSEQDYISGEDEPEMSQFNHCLPFKVMGVTYNTSYQQHLEAAKAVGEDSVLAKVESDPENEHDSNAIAVLINYGSGWVRIGYIAKELTRYIHPLLANGTLVSINVKHIKFCVVYLRVGFYITINITRQGQWEDQVIRASQKVK